MNKLLIGIGTLFVGAFFAVATLQAAPVSTWSSPFHATEETVPYEEDTRNRHFTRGGCHGGSWDEDEVFYRHHHEHWLDDSQVANDHVHGYMHMTEEARETFDLEYARRVNALDIESFDDEEALREALEEIRAEIMKSIWEDDSDE